MPTSLTSYLHVGLTAAQSVHNLHNWLDQVAGVLAGPECLVHNSDNARQPGLFHHMRSNVHAMFESQISNYSTWTGECITNHIERVMPTFLITTLHFKLHRALTR